MTYWYPILDDDEQPIRLPMHKEVCGRCRGEGTIVNPAVDGFSTSDECWQDEDFRDGYLSGRYDITCPDCDGLRVVDVVDEETLERNDPELYARWLASCREWFDDQHMSMMERRYGA